MSFMRNLWLMLYAVNDCNISNFKLIILFFYELIIWSLKFYGCSHIACVILKYFKFLPFPVPHYFLPPCAGVSLLRTLGVASIIFIKKGPLGSVRWKNRGFQFVLAITQYQFVPALVAQIILQGILFALVWSSSPTPTSNRP